MNTPTKKQTILLEFISDFTKTHNFSPSYREIMQAMNLRSVSAVAEHVENCVAAGFLKKTPKASRALEVIRRDDTISKLFTDKIQELKLNPDQQENIEILQKAAKLLELKI